MSREPSHAPNPYPKFIATTFCSCSKRISVQTYFASTTRTLAQPTLNVGMIEQTPIPVPPLAEQRRIVAKVGQLMALVDQLEAQIAAGREVGARLIEAVVGELTAA